MAILDSLKNIAEKEDLVVKNIIEFAEQDLEIRLLPAQKFIFKIFYNIPLSDDIEHNCIPIGDKFNQRVVHKFTEVEFLHYLYENKRINTLDVQNILFTEIIFILGRRASKTTMTSIITLYTIYQLLLLPNPHQYFQIMEADEIGVGIVSNVRDGAERQFRTIIRMIYNSKFFKPYLFGEPSGGMLYLRSNRLRSVKKDRSSDAFNKGDILISVYAASPSVRGASNIVAILDEFAHFRISEESRKDNPLDKVVYEAFTPSTSGFIHPDGRPAGKKFILSSPLGKKGMMYEMYEQAMTGLAKNSLVLKMPSHWVNYRLPQEELVSFYNKSENSYNQEYLSEFVDSRGDWIKQIDKFYACIDKSNGNVLSYNGNRFKYFMGLDFGLSHDGTAIAICHYEPYLPKSYEPIDEKYKDLIGKKDIFVIDYIGYISPYDSGIQEDVQISQILDELEQIMGIVKIEEGIYDNWSGALFEQLLQLSGFNNLKKYVTTQQTNSDHAKLFKQLINEGRVLFPNDKPFIDEVLALKETMNRSGLIKVENTDGHDDRFDAVCRALWLCFNDKDSTLESYSELSKRHFNSKANSNIVPVGGVTASQRFKSNLRNVRGYR